MYALATKLYHIIERENITSKIKLILECGALQLCACGGTTQVLLETEQ